MKAACFLVVVASLFTLQGKGQTIVGADVADNYSTWVNNDNLGTGFGPWNLYETGEADFFLGNSSGQGFGDVNSPTKSFSMWGNPGGGDYANAERHVSTWDTGFSFEIDLAIAHRNGNKGIDIFADGAEVIFTFNVAGDKYKAENIELQDSDGNPWAYEQTSVFHLTAIQYPQHLKINLTRGSNTYSTVIPNKVFSGFKVFVGDTEGGILNNLHFNNLVVTSSPFLLFDSFQRATYGDEVGEPSSNPGSNWIEYETVPSGARTSGGGLHMGSTTAGRDMISFDMTAYYPVALDASTEEMKWAFNMRSNRNNPSGFDASNYGSAFILGSNKADFTDPDAYGYAVVLGNSNSPDTLRLVKFQGGLKLNSALTYITSVSNIDADSFFSIVVSYNSCSHTWNLEVREETSFTQPNTGTFPLSASAIDITYTSSDLPYLGALWNHATGASQEMRIDNIYIPNVAAASNIEYTWIGGATGNFGTPTNWNPSRDCARNRDRLVFEGGAFEVTDVPDQTFGQLIIRNIASVRLRNLPSDTTSHLFLSGGDGQDLIIDSGSVLNLNSRNASYTKEGIILSMNAGTTGEIAGTLQFDNSHNDDGRRHQVLVTDANALHIKNGGRVEAIDLLISYHPFGDNFAHNAVIFESGSTYMSQSGGNPFGFTQPASKVVFQSGSTFQFVDGNSISLSGRNYGNFEFVSGNYTQLFGGNSTCKIDNFTIQSGSLNFVGSTNSLPVDIEIRNDLNLAGGTFNYSPVAHSKMRFAGTQLQSIYGSGALILGDSVAVEIENTANGAALRLMRDIDIRNDLFIIDGQLQSLGARSLSMLGNNSEIKVEADGSIEGTDVGIDNDLTLKVIGNKTTIIGNGINAKFYSVNIDPGDTLILSRQIEVKYGIFNVGNNSKLVLNVENAILTTSPLYSPTSQLIYNVGSAISRNIEWMGNSGAGHPGNVIIQNGTVLYTNNTSSELGIQNDLIIGRMQGGTGTLDMNSDTYPIQVGGDLRLAEGTTIARLTLSDQLNGDLKVMGDFVKVADDAIGIFDQENREVIMNGNSIQDIYGVNNFDYLAIENASSSIRINNDVLINNRLRLVSGLFDLNGFILTMENESEIMREASSATMSAVPTVLENESYDLRYTGAVSAGVEWLATDEAVRDLRVEANIILHNDRTFNRDLYLDGSDLDLNGHVLTARGIGVNPSFAGKIDIAQSGNRNINGSAGSRFDIIGLAGTDPAPFTKQVVNSGADSLVFGSEVEVRIGNGGADFGVGNPTLIKGVLAIRQGGYVINNSCNYAPQSILRFANSFDYEVDPSDLTWASGQIESGLPGIPYNVEVLNAGTDLILNSPRSLRNDLTINDGKFTLTSASGSFDIGGDWNRNGISSDFVHNNQEVIFNGSLPQTINTDNGETYFTLSFDNSGIKTLNENVNVLEHLNIRGSGALNGNSQTITLQGNWNNEVGSSSFMEANSKVIFAGSSTQHVNSMDYETFHDLEMDNAGDGMLMNDPVRISGFITFTNGIIHPNSNDFLIENGGATDGGSIDSYVSGAVIKIGYIESSEFPFPVGYYDAIGGIDVFQPAFITTVSSNSLTGFKAEYVHNNWTPGYTNPNNPPPRDGSLTQVSTCNYWMIDRMSGTPEVDANVGLSWGNSDCIDVGDPDELRVARWNGYEWDNQGLLYGTGNINSGGPDFNSGKVYTLGGFEEFSPFAIGTSGAGLNVLPIQLLSFTATPKNRVVNTRWVTSTEINNHYFTLERSLDAVHFEEVGRVEGAGNSTAEIGYSFADDDPYSGVSYYRLKQTDFDGASTYSQIRAVEIAGKSGLELLKVYRGDDGVNLVYRSEVPKLSVEVFDLLGKQLFSEVIRNENGQTLIQPALVRGIYMLRLSNGVEVVSGKFFY